MIVFQDKVAPPLLPLSRVHLIDLVSLLENLGWPWHVLALRSRFQSAWGLKTLLQSRSHVKASAGGSSAHVSPVAQAQ